MSDQNRPHVFIPVKIQGAGDMEKITYDSNNDEVVDSSDKVEGIDAAGNDKYYGTNSVGSPGFYDLPAGGGDEDNVKITGDQTIDGRKEFTSTIEGQNGITIAGNLGVFAEGIATTNVRIADPVTDPDHAATKAYVDANAGGGSGGVTEAQLTQIAKDYNPRIKRNNTPLWEKWRPSYLAYVEGDQVYRTDNAGGAGTRVTVTTVNLVDNYITTNVPLADWDHLMDLNPSNFGTNNNLPAFIHLNGSVDPDAVVTSFDPTNGRIYFDTSVITGGTNPSVNDELEFHNPFVNMHNVRGENIPLLQGFVNEGAEYKTSGFTVDFMAPGGVFIDSQGRYCLVLNLRVAETSLNSVLAIVRTRDWQTFELDDPFLDASTLGNATRLSTNALTPYKFVHGEDTQTQYILWLCRFNGNDAKPAYMIIDEDGNIIQNVTDLTFDDYGTANQNYQIFDVVLYDNKIRMFGWDWDHTVNNAGDDRENTEYVFDTNDFGKVLDSTATFTKTIVHVGTDPTLTNTLMNSQWATWRYVEYDGRLYAFRSYLDRGVGSHAIANANRGYMWSVLGDTANGDSGPWIHERTGLFFNNYIQGDKFNDPDGTNWFWQYDHVGGPPFIIRDDQQGWLLITTNKAGSNTYVCSGYRLADYTKVNHKAPVAIPRLNDFEAQNAPNIKGGFTYYSTDQNEILSYNANTTSWVSLSAAGAGGADGVISNVALAGTDLNFTGANGGFNGTVDLSSLSGGGSGQWDASGNDIYNSNIGRVGIGTSTPETDFHVEGRAYIDPNNVASPNATRLLDIVDNNTSAVRDNYPTLTVRNRSRSTGPGTNPSLADIGFFADDGVVKGYLRGDGFGSYFPTGGWGLAGETNHNFYITTNNTPRLAILNTGEVGIGTDSPSTALEVVGDIYLSQVGDGVIMKSPDGNCWRVTVDNAGAFVSTSIVCP
jgi:hypothetical protein